jgi:guanine deaminase
MSAGHRTELRGAFLCPGAERGSFRLLRDGVLRISEEGRIESLEPAPIGSDDAPTTPGCVWMPGFVDTHVHFPQTRALGRSSGTLLKWLEKTIFSEEARFADDAYASDVAREFCGHLLRQGTTSASIYGSSHASATELLFQELERSGLRAQAGLCLMDRGAPDELCVPAEQALRESEALARRWDGRDHGRLRFCVTPRFALSCSPELLRGAAALSVKLSLPVQTHLSENLEEIEAVSRQFPENTSYLETYDAHGLCHERSLFGHAIHLSESEWQLMASRRAAVSHCPDSNFFLGSGTFRLSEAERHGVRVGLGSDVGAGRTFSMRRIASSAYDAALLQGRKLDPAEVLWLATVGGAEALGWSETVGRLEPGMEADLVAIECRAAGEAGATREEILDALVFNTDDCPVRETWVRGRKLWERAR